MIISVSTRDGEYPIYLERGGLEKAAEVFKLDRKCMIVTDDGIPSEYVKTLEKQCKEASVFVIPQGEGSKSLSSFEAILGKMLSSGFTRSDCVVALGGGVVGDLAGFVASAFLRGVDFYNIPTTVLSQVDSSIGGKVAVNFMGLKNMVGAFYPPKAVLIDSETLKTLPPRQIASGLAESVKMAATFDEEFFRLLEEKDPLEEIDLVIEKSLLVKKAVVEKDEREAGLRKVLNFGHTLAHAIESESHKKGEPFTHGESVALGMIPMCAPEERGRLVAVLQKIGLPTKWEGDPSVLTEAMRHDKKMSGEFISVVRVDQIGSFRLDKIPFSMFEEEVKGGAK